MTTAKAGTGTILSQEQREQFWHEGYLIVDGAVDGDTLARLGKQMDDWTEESRSHTAPYGPPTVDGRPRFDLEENHSPAHPALRRINNPAEISDDFHAVMTDAPMVDMVTDLIGPDVKYHHCKINSKLPGSQMVVRYHQDFCYTPHTNDDVITALLLLDDVDEANGCLMAVPGSHRGSIDSLFQDGVFTGMVDPVLEKDYLARQVPIEGKAGAVCLMHTRLLHASEPNLSPTRRRAIYLCVYSAADAVPIARNPMPSSLEGTIVRGQASPTARMIPLRVELPQQPKSASFFTVIGQKSAG
ncbi:MAG: phytanoyl-CoA dioxygenase family protein [Alphaproteobacteria bacterium]|jgi:ectoine hydroxylase-related dioxygenase (phytanoyl-CoA dioxygenase family)